MFHWGTNHIVLLPRGLSDPARHLDDAVVRAGDARSISAKGDDKDLRADPEGPVGSGSLKSWLVMLAVDPRTKTCDLCQEWLALHPLPEFESWTEDAENFFS